MSGVPERYKQAREQIASGKLLPLETEVYGEGSSSLTGEIILEVSGLRPDSRDQTGRRVNGNFREKIKDFLEASRERGDIVDNLTEAAVRGDKKVYFTIVVGAFIFISGVYAEKRRGWKDISLLKKLIKRYGKNPSANK